MIFRSFIIRFIFLTLMIFPVIGFIYFFIHNFQSLDCSYGYFKKKPAQIIKKIPWPQKGLLTLWFDDAYLSQASPEVLKLMHQYGFVAGMSVPTGFICKPGYLTWKQLQKLQDIGWEIISHSVSHYCEPQKYANNEIIQHEVVDSKMALASRGFYSEQFVIPCGFNQKVLPLVVEEVKKHYQSYRIAVEKINSLPLKDPYAITSIPFKSNQNLTGIESFIKKAQQSNGWLIITFHQMDNENLNYHTNIKDFEKLLKIIHNSGIPVVLPTQAIRVGT